MRLYVPWRGKFRGLNPRCQYPISAFAKGQKSPAVSGEEKAGQVKLIAKQD
jgi:hypothetical protein